MPAGEAERHIIKRVEPVYPPMASQPQIQKKVVLEITIAPDGSVVQARTVSGHPMLVQAALDAVKSWKYTPFMENGAPVAVRSQVRFLFAMGPDAAAEQKYFLQENACQDGLQMQRFEEAYKLCRAALQTANELNPESFEFRISAYGNAGIAAFRRNRYPEAVQDFQDRLKLAQKNLPPDRAEWFYVHHDLALTLMVSGQMDQAENEYRETEKALDALSKSVDQAATPKDDVVRRQEQLRAQMRQTFSEHADLLQQMGRYTDAAKLEAQAKSLN